MSKKSGGKKCSFGFLLSVTFNSNKTFQAETQLFCLPKEGNALSKSTDKLPPHEDFNVKACVKILELATNNIRESRAKHI